MGVGQLREGSKVIFRITSRRVTMLLASLALLLGIPAAAGAASSSAATSIGWISLGNLSSTLLPVDVYVYSSGDSSPMIVLHDVAYGFVSDFQIVNAGDYSVTMRSAGSSASSNPVWSVSLTVQAGRSYTVAPQDELHGGATYGS